MVSRRFRNRVNLSGGSAPAIAARIESLESGDVAIYRKDLAEVAQASNTYDREVQLAAIAKLDDIATLTDLLNGEAEIARAAADSIARLIHENGQEYRASSLATPSVRLAFIRASRDENAVAPLLEALPENDLVTMASEASHPSVRRAAASRVQSEHALSEVAGKAKSRDKNVYRTARTRLDKIRGSRRSLMEANTRAEDIAERLAELANLPVDRTFASKVKILQQEWQECESAHAHTLQSCPKLAQEFSRLAGSETFGRALQRANARLATDQVTDADEPMTTTNAPPPALRETGTLMPSRLTDDDEKELAKLLESPPPTFSTPNSVDEHRRVWQDMKRLAPLTRRLSSMRAQVNASISAQIETWLGAASAYGQATNALENELLERFESKAAALKSEIEAGHLGKANDLRRECGDCLRMLSEERARRLWKQLRATDKDMQRLRDWQSYAATPKRESLCERMSEIVDRPLGANEQVDHIRLLREEWKATGPLTGAKDHELHRRFERLAEAAYAPCREHFQEQSGLRKRNLATRRQICADLALYIREKDWQNPDWKTVDRILRTARSEWRNAHPIERSKAKALQRQFDELCDQLFARLSGHWKGNEVKARGLIAELRALLESTSSVERRVDGTSAIQARWREVGAMSQSANRKLWKEFRGLCDQVYTQRRTQKDQQNEAYKDRLEKARTLIAKLEEILANAEPRNLTTGDLTSLAGEWETFKDMRGESFKKVEIKWKDLSRRYRQLLRESDAARQIALLELAERLDNGLCDAEQAMLGEDAVPEEALTSLDEDGAKLFGKTSLPRLEQLRQGTLAETDMKRNLARRRRMCVMLDIYLERESPPEDKGLRLEIQVERINRGASGLQSGQQDAMDSARDWCDAGPVAAEGKMLSERFFSALKEVIT